MYKLNNLQTEFSYLKEKNKFNKYSISVKFNKNSPDQMEQLENLKQAYKLAVGKDMYVKDKLNFQTIEISNLFKNFDFVKDGETCETTHLPFDSIVNVGFNFIETKAGKVFPCLALVEVLKFNVESLETNKQIENTEQFKRDNADSEFVINKRNNSVIDGNVIEVSRIAFIKELNQYKEIFLRDGAVKMFYYHRNNEILVSSKEISETVKNELLREIDYIKNNDKREINWSLREDKIIENEEKISKEYTMSEEFEQCKNNFLSACGVTEKPINKTDKENKEKLRSGDDGLNESFSLYYNKFKKFPLYNTSKIIYKSKKVEDMDDGEINEAINRLSMFFKLRYTKDDILSKKSFEEIRTEREKKANNDENRQEYSPNKNIREKYKQHNNDNNSAENKKRKEATNLQSSDPEFKKLMDEILPF